MAQVRLGKETGKDEPGWPEEEDCVVQNKIFYGFGGLELHADVHGSSEDPMVLMLHSTGQTRQVWTVASEALVRAGRQVINIDLRGHGDSQHSTDRRYDFASYVEDLRCVLSQLSSRPVIVAAAMSGWLAATAIGEDGGHLAAGLVLVDVPAELDEPAAEKMAEALRARAARSPDQLDWDPEILSVFDTQAALERVSGAAEKIAMPVLFVRGAQSAMTDKASATRYVERMQNAEIVEISEAGHLVVDDRSEEFNAVLIDFLERKSPRAAPEYRSGSDARTLRDAMGCFATGVTVVTTQDENGDPVGLTANSFTSVSLDPPLLLVCIANSATSLNALETAGHFAVNVLHIGQQQTSNLFARPGEDRFSQTPWVEGEKGAPLLEGALANYECARHAVHDGGDHIILVGRVERARFDSRRDPLLYFRGKYRRLHFA